MRDRVKYLVPWQADTNDPADLITTETNQSANFLPILQQAATNCLDSTFCFDRSLCPNALMSLTPLACEDP